MRTRLAILALLLGAATATAQDLLLLLDGLDAELIGEFDLNGEPLAPWLARFEAASDGARGRATVLDSPDAGAGFGRSALDILRAGSESEREALTPDEALRRLREGDRTPLLVWLQDDPRRSVDDELLLRCDPTPWVGGETVRGHSRLRERRLQRAQALWQLRSANRAPRDGGRGADGDWLARVRVVELELQLRSLLEFLLSDTSEHSVLLSATHGARTHADDLAERARRVPMFGLRGSFASPQTLDPHWTLRMPLRPGESLFARQDVDDVLRIERGRILLFDAWLDPEERFDLARLDDRRVIQAIRAATREIFGGDDARLRLRIESAGARQFLIGPLAADRLLDAGGLEVEQRGEMLLLQLAAGSSALVEIELHLDDPTLRLQGDLGGMSLQLGSSPWLARGELRFDLRSGALLAAIQNATGAPQGPGDRLRAWIEPVAQRPAEGP